MNKLDNVNVIYFLHSHARFSSREGRGGNSPGRTWNTSRSTEISNSSAGPTPRGDQAMQSLHVVLGRPLGRFPAGLASMTCLASLSLGIWTHGRTNVAKRRCDILIWRNGSTFRALRISKAAQFVAKCHTRGVTRGTKGEKCTWRRISGDIEKSQQYRNFFLQYSKFTPKKP